MAATVASIRLSLFPLPGTVLYPGLQLPLHIFEPRYRALISDALAQARAGLALAEDAPDVAELDGLRAAAAERPADMDAQLAFANALIASGDRQAAADQLLEMVTADRTWNEGAARARLLQLFEATGLEDPWVATTRRRLSTVLFG